MGGRVKKSILNRKRSNLKASIKKKRSMKKKVLPTEEVPAPAPSPEAPEIVEDVPIDGEKAPKTPLVNENRTSRVDMPLKVDYQSRKTTKANKHTNVIHRQPMSKKKFNKMQKAIRHAERDRETAANQMEA